MSGAAVGKVVEGAVGEHRREARHRAFLGAKLVYGDGAFTLDCVVRDISVDGARVKLPQGQAVPDRLFLVEIRSGIAYEAQVAWKRHPEIGLTFIHQFGLREASTPHLMILKRLWVEQCQRSGIF
jgi:hypothetical protein